MTLTSGTLVLVYTDNAVYPGVVVSMNGEMVTVRIRKGAIHKHSSVVTKERTVYSSFVSGGRLEDIEVHVTSLTVR